MTKGERGGSGNSEPVDIGAVEALIKLAEAAATNAEGTGSEVQQEMLALLVVQEFQAGRLPESDLVTCLNTFPSAIRSNTLTEIIKLSARNGVFLSERLISLESNIVQQDVNRGLAAIILASEGNADEARRVLKTIVDEGRRRRATEIVETEIKRVVGSK